MDIYIRLYYYKLNSYTCLTARPFINGRNEMWTCLTCIQKLTMCIHVTVILSGLRYNCDGIYVCGNGQYKELCGGCWFACEFLNIR